LGLSIHLIHTATLFDIPSSSGIIVTEEFLLQKATDGCNQIVAALWQLPVERSDVGPNGVAPWYGRKQDPPVHW